MYNYYQKDEKWGFYFLSSKRNCAELDFQLKESLFLKSKHSIEYEIINNLVLCIFFYHFVIYIQSIYNSQKRNKKGKK